MKWLAIVNPSADHHSRDRLQQLGEELKRRAGADCIWTRSTRNAWSIVKRNQGYDGYIAVGGDGTISEVVNGMDHDRHCLAIIPAGTGNGLARDLKLNNEPAAVRSLSAPRFQRLDLIKVAYRVHRAWRWRWMVSTSAIGYVAGATRVSNHASKRRGAWIYAAAAIIQSLRQGTFIARLRLDHEAWRRFSLTNLVVHNTQHIGQFRLFPEASVADGRLNLLYGRLPPFQQLVEDLGILTHTYLFERSVHRQGHCVEIELGEPTTLMADGELVEGVTGVRYHVFRRRLRCCTGPLSGAPLPSSESFKVARAVPAALGPVDVSATCPAR